MFAKKQVLGAQSANYNNSYSKNVVCPFLASNCGIMLKYHHQEMIQFAG